MKQLNDNNGFTLLELAAVIVILGIISVIATSSLSSRIEKSRFQATVVEMNAIARAISGDPNLYHNGQRSDYGYVGDIGAMPPNLEALTVNPGFATWNGPYLADHFGIGDVVKDAWGVEYLLDDNVLRSTGSGENIDKLLTPDLATLLDNALAGYICDADGDRPGPIYRDSLLILMTHPDGMGGRVMKFMQPDQSGYFTCTGIPVGNHDLDIIYIPEADTISLKVGVIPGKEIFLDIILPADLW